MARAIYSFSVQQRGDPETDVATNCVAVYEGMIQIVLQTAPGEPTSDFEGRGGRIQAAFWETGSRKTVSRKILFLNLDESQAWRLWLD